MTAGRLGLDPVLMAASNSSGGVMGKMISLQSIAVAAGATGMPSDGRSEALPLHAPPQPRAGLGDRPDHDGLRLRLAILMLPAGGLAGTPQPYWRSTS